MKLPCCSDRYLRASVPEAVEEERMPFSVSYGLWLLLTLRGHLYFNNNAVTGLVVKTGALALDFHTENGDVHFPETQHYCYALPTMT